MNPIGIASLLIGGYFLLSPKKKTPVVKVIDPVVIKTATPAKTTVAVVAANDSFPLKKGSKGQRVKTIQTAIITKYGKSILPVYGADGDFGSETSAAFKKIGLREPLDQAAYTAFMTTANIKAPAAPDAINVTAVRDAQVSTFKPGEMVKAKVNVSGSLIEKDFNGKLILVPTVTHYKPAGQNVGTFQGLYPNTNFAMIKANDNRLFLFDPLKIEKSSAGYLKL